VLLTLASGLFLLPSIGARHKRLIVSLLFGLIAIHLFFVFSAVAFIAGIAWILVLAFFGLLRRYRPRTKRQGLYGFITVVITPGLVVPFIIARIPGLAVYLVAEDVLNKGTNWGSKIGFLNLGSALYTRFLPVTGEIPSAGHNLVLSTYLQFGYFLSIPLLIFLYLFLARTFERTAFPVLAGGALTVIAHTMVVPPQLFYPAGSMWVMMAAGVAYHSRVSPARPTAGGVQPASSAIPNLS
jgi:hypothetical protein